jgi:hypothetical protein
VFVEVDHDSRGVLATIEARRDVPAPSYVLQSSPDRMHVFWRATGFTTRAAEQLQQYLARELGADRAATSCAQMSRLVGFLNHKYVPAALVGVKYGRTTPLYTPDDFPRSPAPSESSPARRTPARAGDRDVETRARRYLAALPPAVAGQHGDLRTFRVCCRLARGFGMSDADALRLLAEWNARCQPPWSERELIDKLRHARRYGRESIGGLLEAQR